MDWDEYAEMVVAMNGTSRQLWLEYVIRRAKDNAQLSAIIGLQGKVIRRLGPAKAPDGGKMTPGKRLAEPLAAADYDGDGRDELALAWFAPAAEAAWKGIGLSQWWITDGSRDESGFDTEGW